MPSKEQLRSAWAEEREARKQGRSISDKTRRILNEYRRAGMRDYQRRRRSALYGIPAHVFTALRARGVSAQQITRHSDQLQPRSRYLIVGIPEKNGRKTVCIMHFNKETTVIKALSEAPFGAILIDTKEIR